MSIAEVLISGGEMQVISEINGIEYGPLTFENLEGAITCVSQSFVTGEPLSVHLGISLEEFLLFARAAYPRFVAEGMSIVARDKTSGQIVGVRISEDFVQDHEEIYIPGLSPKFHPLFAILSSLGQHFQDLRQPQKGQYAHLFMIAVNHHYAGKGIAPNMNRLFFQRVIDMGYTHAVTEPTGAISQHILLDKFGFSCLHHIDYAEFLFEDERPFEGLQGHRCVMLLEKELACIDLDQHP